MRAKALQGLEAWLQSRQECDQIAASWRENGWNRWALPWSPLRNALNGYDLLVSVLEVKIN